MKWSFTLQEDVDLQCFYFMNWCFRLPYQIQAFLYNILELEQQVPKEFNCRLLGGVFHEWKYMPSVDRTRDLLEIIRTMLNFEINRSSDDELGEVLVNFGRTLRAWGRETYKKGLDFLLKQFQEE